MVTQERLLGASLVCLLGMASADTMPPVHAVSAVNSNWGFALVSMGKAPPPKPGTRLRVRFEDRIMDVRVTEVTNGWVYVRLPTSAGP
jgi:hypothetical protein